MLNFKEWFIINETKEEKALASELAGDALAALSAVIPQNNKNADKLLLLAAYYYSQTKDLEQVKTDIKDYIGYLNRDKMKLISVDLVSKKPPSPWDNYLRWTEDIHMHQGEDAFNQRSKFKPSDIDFQDEKPIMISPDGKIKVYESNNPDKCIILGRGQSFCISQPGNRMWQSYRDRDTSTYYFVYDDTRPADDRLGIVVVDVRPNGIVLTDKINDTGRTLNPYNGQVTNDSKQYMRYLREKGIDTSKFVNIPKSSEEQKEHEELGEPKKELDWFIALSHDYKSKYIGRGHRLTNEQFDYLWENKFTSLLTQYVKTGLLLNDHQIDKIASNRDLKDNYLHNRLIADQQSGNLSDKEYYLFSPKHKEIYYGNMNNDNKLKKAIKFNELGMVRYFVEEKGFKISDDAVGIAGKNRHLDMVKYLVEKGAEINYGAVSDALIDKNLALVKYLVENGGKINDGAVTSAAYSGDLDLVTYLVEKGATIDGAAVQSAVYGGNLDVVTYLVEKGATIDEFAINQAVLKNNLDMVTYLVKNGGKIHDGTVANAAKDGNLDLVKYLVKNGGKIIDNIVTKSSALRSNKLDVVKYFIEEKGIEITVYHAIPIKDVDLKIIKYLVEKDEEKGLKISDNAVNYAIASNGNLDMIKYFIEKIEEKGGKINDSEITAAIESNKLDVVKYLVGEKGLKISDDAVESAVDSGRLDVVRYLVENGGKITDKAVQNAINSDRLDIVKYFVEKGGKITDNAVTIAARIGDSNMVDYLNSVRNNN
jgi:ankyrin repeat protein